MTTTKHAAEIFNRDVDELGGYRYALGDALSTRLATGRWLTLMLGLTSLTDRAVIDIGCGDGSFTVRYFDACRPRLMAAIDPAAKAVAAGKSKAGTRPIHFQVADGHRLPYADDTFDLALLQAILHHDDDPTRTIAEAFRVAREILVLEPNGYSPILKLLERFGPYHRAHEERSYSPPRLRAWVEAAGGHVVRGRLGVAVPMFSPDWMARTLAFAEPMIERTPGLNRVLCAVYVFNARRD